MIVLASGLNVPDDLLYLAADGTVMTGEHGSGRLAIVGGASRLKRLPQVIGEAEGIAQIGSTIYVADQLHNRVVALTGSGVRTVIQLQPDPNGLNLDGIAGNGTQLIVPDSPHGTVLLVDPSGHVAARWAGLQPAGGRLGRDPLPVPDRRRERQRDLRAEEAAAASPRWPATCRGSTTSCATRADHVLVTLPGLGVLRDVTPGGNVASGLSNPQGLDFDGAQNLLVTESDSGRLDLIVKTFALTVPAPAVRLLPGQGVCLGITRGSGLHSLAERRPGHRRHRHHPPGTSNSFEVLPQPCSAAACTVSLQVTSPAGREFAYFTYRD